MIIDRVEYIHALATDPEIRKHLDEAALAIP